jgi:hypothetical protein
MNSRNVEPPSVALCNDSAGSLASEMRANNQPTITPTFVRFATGCSRNILTPISARRQARFGELDRMMGHVARDKR